MPAVVGGAGGSATSGCDLLSAQCEIRRHKRKVTKTSERPWIFERRETGGGKLGIGGRLGGRLGMCGGTVDEARSAAPSAGGADTRSGVSFEGGGAVIGTPFIARPKGSTQSFVGVIAERISAR